MKYIKKFEAKKSTEELIELLEALLNENPLHNTHDFYIFIGRDEFKEGKNGKYTKSLEIENMVKIKSDASSLDAMSFMQMRARFQGDSTLYHIWLPKNIENQISGKGSNRIDPKLIKLINKNKRSGSDSHGKQALNDVMQRIKNVNKFNI